MATDGTTSEKQLMTEEDNYERNSMMQIDPTRARFPCCIVWTPLPLLSWLVPFIGHIGICREDGVILDFAGPNFVSVDNFAFGSVARYIQIDKVKDCSLATASTSIGSSDHHEANDLETERLGWDNVLRKSTQEFQHRSYNILTCNCHSFVANNLNRMGFGNSRWNVVNLAVLIFLKGKWVSRVAMIRAYVPFVVVTCIGLALGGLSFFKFLGFFCAVVFGWFFIGSYCFKNLIQL